jgi:hypothetical protein
MKKIVLLVLALIAGCIIFMFVYNQRQNAELAQKLGTLPEEVINDIEETREDLSDEADENGIINDLDKGMTKIKDDYQKSMGEEMPEDVEDAIGEGLVTEAIEKE